MEIWKDIEGWRHYQVSSHGRVRSKKRKVRWAHHGVSGLSNISGKVLSPIPRVMNKNLTYMQVGFHDGVNKKTQCYLVHQLVARTFIPNLENKPQVNHIDGNGQNNHIDNLEWATSSENSLHARRVLGRRAWHAGNLGKDTPTARAVIQKTLEGDFVRKWDCASDAVREFGFDSGAITHCCKGEMRKHKGYTWEYAK